MHGVKTIVLLVTLPLRQVVPEYLKMVVLMSGEYLAAELCFV